jgi:DNA-binding IclR family transcriptional regulator
MATSLNTRRGTGSLVKAVASTLLEKSISGKDLSHLSDQEGNYRSLRRHVNTLVRRGFLLSEGQTHGRRYRLSPAVSRRLGEALADCPLPDALPRADPMPEEAGDTATACQAMRRSRAWGRRSYI